MEKVDAIRDPVLDEHPLCRSISFVAERRSGSRLIMAKIANGKLTYRDLVVAELDHPLEDFRCSECPRHC